MLTLARTAVLKTTVPQFSLSLVGALPFIVTLAMTTFPLIAHALCGTLANTSLALTESGGIRMSQGVGVLNKLMYCDATTWRDFPGSATTTPCTKNGEIIYNSPKPQYCNNGFYWNLESSPTAGAVCSKPGQLKWNNPGMSFCDGSSDQFIQTADTVPDAFTLPSASALGSQASSATAVQITGFTGGTANISFSTAACSGLTVRVFADALFTTQLASRSSNGTLAVPNGAWLRMQGSSGAQAGDTCSATVDIGGMNSTATFTTGTDTSPSLQTAYVNIYGQPENTVVASNIALWNGHTGISFSIDDGGSGGTPELRTCLDSACASVDVDWTPGPIANVPNPRYVQMRTSTGGPLTWKQVRITGGTGSPQTWFVMTSTCPLNTTLSPGQSLTCTCPGNMQSTGLIRGTGNYAQSSQICRSAVNAGKIPFASGGTVTVIGSTAGSPSGTCPSFTGSSANGVATASSATPATSMYFSGSPDVCN